MNDTIFPVLSLDRGKVRWEDFLGVLTPWEEHQGIWFKREDHFAPLGYGGPNGSKMRQLIWYFENHRKGKPFSITGASVQSPQLSMTAIVGRHFGMSSVQVVYSKPETLMRHDNPRMAAGFGACFNYVRGPYNPIIQAEVKRLGDLCLTGMVVPYGISLSHKDNQGWKVKAFHNTGARQVENIPDEVTRLVVPAGSCNTLCSVVLGLIEDPHNVKELYTLGIGPDKRQWFRERFDHMGISLGDLPFKWKHVSLHEAGYGKYGDQYRGESWDGIDFHPVYEGRMWRWLRTFNPLEQDGHTGFWIVGSAAQEAVVRPFYTNKEEI